VRTPEITMMHHLDSDDMRLLDDILSQHLRSLLAEIAHADNRAFRDHLRDRYERVEALRRRLTSRPEATAGAHA
jgi:hypothetical protein